MICIYYTSIKAKLRSKCKGYITQASLHNLKIPHYLLIIYMQW